MKVVQNHWGWSPRGVWTWMRYGWAWPFTTWGVEISGSSPRMFERRVKIGPVAFGWGTFRDEGRL